MYRIGWGVGGVRTGGLIQANPGKSKLSEGGVGNWVNNQETRKAGVGRERAHRAQRMIEGGFSKLIQLRTMSVWV
ncbi:MAG: hypothetical protein JWR69_1164, partial [Pedosphaera sp.]|nr:hypothetical protein [Pedosphaera sp.]